MPAADKSKRPLDDDDFGDILSLLGDDNGEGENDEVDTSGDQSGDSPDEQPEGDDGTDDLFADPDGGDEGDDDQSADAEGEPEGGEGTNEGEPAPAASGATSAELKSVLDLSKRLAAISEANERRRQEEIEERDRLKREEAEARRKEEMSRPLYEEGDLGLTDDERLAYKDSLPVLNKVARQVAQDLYQRSVVPLREEIASLRQQASTLDESTTRTRAETFVSALRGAVPDLNQRTSDPGWQAYLQEAVSVPGYGRMARAKAIELATEKSDLSYVVDQVKSFKATAARRPQGSVSPGRGVAAGQSTTRRPKPKSVSYSKAVQRLTEMSREVQRGRLPLAKYEAAMTSFETAVEEGRVDMDS